MKLAERMAAAEREVAVSTYLAHCEPGGAKTHLRLARIGAFVSPAPSCVIRRALETGRSSPDPGPAYHDALGSIVASLSEPDLLRLAELVELDAAWDVWNAAADLFGTPGGEAHLVMETARVLADPHVTAATAQARLGAAIDALIGGSGLTISGLYASASEEYRARVSLRRIR